jgi:hypothetical protein
MQRYVENKNPPQVRFIRKNGRIIPIVQGKQSYKASNILHNEIDRLTMEVDVAEAGRRVQYSDGTWGGNKSTFPSHFKSLNFKTKKQWMGAVESQKGPAFDRILDLAKNSKDFKVATKQLYDNKLVVFKTIDSKVRPIRTKDQDSYEFYSWTARK